MKRSFFQAAVVLILLYRSTTWTQTKWVEKKLDGNYTRMLRAILNNSWRQHPTRHQLYGHLPPITKTIQVRRTRHTGHCWRSRDELISDVLLWTPTYGRAKAGRPARTHIQQLCEDTGYSPEDLPEAMNDREKWRERVRDIRASCMTWCWWRWSRVKWSNPGKGVAPSPIFRCSNYWKESHLVALDYGRQLCSTMCLVISNDSQICFLLLINFLCVQYTWMYFVILFITYLWKSFEDKKLLSSWNSELIFSFNSGIDWLID